MIIVSHFREIYTKQPCTSRKLSTYPESVSSLNTEQGNLLNEILEEKKEVGATGGNNRWWVNKS